MQLKAFYTTWANTRKTTQTKCKPAIKHTHPRNKKPLKVLSALHFCGVLFFDHKIYETSATRTQTHTTAPPSEFWTPKKHITRWYYYLLRPLTQTQQEPTQRYQKQNRPQTKRPWYMKRHGTAKPTWLEPNRHDRLPDTLPDNKRKWMNDTRNNPFRKRNDNETPKCLQLQNPNDTEKTETTTCPTH